MAKYVPKQDHAPIDPNAKVPAAIAEQTRRANALLEGKDPNAPPAPEQNGQDTQQGNNQPAIAQPQPQPSPNPAPTPPQPLQPQPPQRDQTPQPGSDDNNETWKHKFESAQGRLSSLQRTNDELFKRASNLERLLGELQSMPARPSNTNENGNTVVTPQGTPKELQPIKLITDQERQDFGPELVDLMGKAAEERLSPLQQRLANALQEVENLKRQVNGVATVQAVDSTQRVFQILDSGIKNWREINTQKDFIDWADQVDPYSGRLRSELMQEAFNRHDGERVLAFFKGFLAERSAMDPAGSQPVPNGGPPNGNGAQQNGKIPLENYAAPGRGRTSAEVSVSPDEKPPLKRSEIGAFYADVAAGRYRGQEALQKQREAYIWECQTAGRIIDG